MKARISTKFKTHMYQGFSGLNSARDDIALERPDAQPFLEMDNLYCSSKGYLSNEPGISNLGDFTGHVTHVKHHNSTSGAVVYASRDAAGPSLRCHGSTAKQIAVWPRGASVCSAIFNRNVILLFLGPLARSRLLLVELQSLPPPRSVCRDCYARAYPSYAQSPRRCRGHPIQKPAQAPTLTHQRPP